MAKIGLQWIGVKEASSITPHSGQAVVQQSDFSHVDIASILVLEEHSHVEEDIAHCGARFQVGVLVRQYVLGTESFNTVDGAQSAGHMHLAIDNIVPDLVQGFGIVLGRQQAIDFCHGGVLVSGTYGMAGCGGLLADGQMLLRVGWRINALPFWLVGDTANIQKLLGHL